MIREANYNQKISMQYGLKLKEGAYLDYLVKLSLINKRSEIKVNRNETLARLPVLFKRTDTVYRCNKELEKQGVLSILEFGKTDTLLVNSDILTNWLNGFDTNKVMTSFESDMSVPVKRVKEPAINRKFKKPIPNQVRWQVFERDMFRCKNCKSHLELSVDHIVPESKGGTQDLKNLQTLCLTSNRSKGVKTMQEWKGDSQ